MNTNCKEVVLDTKPQHGKLGNECKIKIKQFCLWLRNANTVSAGGGGKTQPLQHTRPTIPNNQWLLTGETTLTRE